MEAGGGPIMFNKVRGESAARTAVSLQGTPNSSGQRHAPGPLNDARSASTVALDEPATIRVPQVPSLNALRALSDQVGIIQRTAGIASDRQNEYRLEHQARGLVLVHRASQPGPAERRTRAAGHAAFLQAAWDPKAGTFRAAMHIDRRWSDSPASEEACGQALWALGRTAQDCADADLRAWAIALFDEALPAIASLEGPRAKASVMLAATAMLRARPDHGPSQAALASGADILERLLGGARRPDWAWFEAVLGHDNPRLPQALIEAGEALGRPQWTALGLETLAWVTERQTAASGHFRPIGTDSADRPYVQLPFDQQPLEAHAAIDAAAVAFRVSGERRWIAHADAAWRWFFGDNDHGAVLADLATGRCRDGITPQGVSPDCGAESILALQLAFNSLLELARADAAMEPRRPARAAGAGQRTTLPA